MNIPVLVPGQPPMSVALLGLQRSDMRLLHVAAKLGPVILRMAQEHAAQKVGSFLFTTCAGMRCHDMWSHAPEMTCAWRSITCSGASN